MTKDKAAIIVGASSGMGKALALRLARAGYRLGLVARREDELNALAERMNKRSPGRVHVYPHDVTNYGEIPALFQQITHDIGGMEIFFYSAGVMPPVASDEYNFEKDRKVYEVNVLGAIAWLNQAAIRCERQQTGTIAALSSVAGDRGRKGQPVYGSSKAALNTYLEGLRNRLGHRGVSVVTIKAGPVRTPMTEGLKMPFMIDADDAANRIHRALQRRNAVAYVPKIWWPIMLAIRSIPSLLFRGKDL